jgi:hypothetical protein
MKSTTFILLSFLLIFSTSCENGEEINTPTDIKINVTDTQGKPIKDFHFNFIGTKPIGLLNSQSLFFIRSQTDNKGNCQISVIIPKETLNFDFDIVGDSLYNFKDTVYVSQDSLNFESYFNNPDFVIRNFKKGKESRFYFKVDR